MKNFKKLVLAACVLATNLAAGAHPGHGNVAAVHGHDFGAWLMHQFYDGYLLALAALGVLVALVAKTLSTRRRPA